MTQVHEITWFGGLMAGVSVTDKTTCLPHRTTRSDKTALKKMAATKRGGEEEGYVGGMADKSVPCFTVSVERRLIRLSG